MAKLFPTLTACAFAVPIAIVSAVITPAFAATVNLTQTTSNNIGFSNLQESVKVEYNDLGTGGVRFDIKNIGPTVLSITEVYFGRLTAFTQALTFSTIENTAGSKNVAGGGVKYSLGANPNNPGGGITWEAAFAADPDAPGGYNKNGIDTGEALGIVFNYKDGYNFQSIANGFANDSLTFAMHVQSVGGSGGGSEWIASNPNITAVPEPITVLGTLGAIGVGAGLKRKSEKVKNAADNT